MNFPSLNTIQVFTLENIPNLDVVVLASLELLIAKPLPDFPSIPYTRPLVVGSGNAEATGRILFEHKDAIFASESNYEAKLNAIPAIDGVVLISASGGKHAPIIAKKAKSLGKHVTLITDTNHNPTEKELDLSHYDHEVVFPKNREPYTYNTSTYMSMILSLTKEDPARIKLFIEEVVDHIDFSKLAHFTKFYVIIPSRFSQMVRMIQVKFIELFGRMIARDVETDEYVRHATTVVESDELFIAFGEPNTSWGKEANRINVPLPEWADYGTMMAVSYYVMGKLQASQPDYFKKNIAKYTEEISKVFGEHITPIVE